MVVLENENIVKRYGQDFENVIRSLDVEEAKASYFMSALADYYTHIFVDTIGWDGMIQTSPMELINNHNPTNISLANHIYSYRDKTVMKKMAENIKNSPSINTTKLQTFLEKWYNHASTLGLTDFPATLTDFLTPLAGSRPLNDILDLVVKDIYDRIADQAIKDFSGLGPNRDPFIDVQIFDAENFVDHTFFKVFKTNASGGSFSNFFQYDLISNSTGTTDCTQYTSAEQVNTRTYINLLGSSDYASGTYALLKCNSTIFSPNDYFKIKNSSIQKVFAIFLNHIQNNKNSLGLSFYNFNSTYTQNYEELI